MGNNASAAGGTTSRFLLGCPPIPPAPPDDQVQAQFDELLRSKLVAATLASEMNSIESIDSKWMYVFLSSVVATPEFADKELLDAHTCIEELSATTPTHDASLHELSRAMRINMVLRSKEWMDKFIDASGVAALVALLDPGRTLGSTDHEEVVNALIALAISSHGVDAMAQTSEYSERLIQVYTSEASSNAVRRRVLKLLGVTCGRVASSSSTHSLAWLSKSLVDNSSEDATLQLELVVYVNSLLNATTEAVDRVAIRDELEKNGFATALEKLRASESRDLMEQLRLFFASAADDKHKLAPPPPPPPVQRRLSLSLSSANEETVSTQPPSSSTATTATTASTTSSDTQSTPQREGPRSLQSRKSLMLDMSELHTETEEVAAIVSPPPAPEPVQRRLSGTLPSLSIPKVNMVQFSSPKVTSPQPSAPSLPPAERSTATTTANSEGSTPSLEAIVSMLQLGTKQLDQQTNDKLLQVLASLATSLSSSDGGKVVDKVAQSLRPPVQEETARVEPSQGVLPRISLKLPARYSESDVSSFSRFYGNSSNSGLDSGASTPARPPSQSITASDSHAPRSPAHSHYEEEHSPRRSMTETESYDESSHEHELATRAKTTSGAKLALSGFFQHLKKGQGLPTTPAPTPMATASVKKDARRPVFPSFGNMSAAPSPLPVHVGSHQQHFGSLPPLTPLKPSVSLPPMTPLKPSLPPLTPLKPSSASHSTPIAMIKSPRVAQEEHSHHHSHSHSHHHSQSHLEAVREEESDGQGPDVAKFRKLLAMGAPLAAVKAKMQQAGVDPALLDQPTASLTAASSSSEPQAVSSSPDISKFRKLLTMGAPLAAVKAKMQQAGLDPALLDQPEPPPVSVASTKTEETPETPLPPAGPVKVKDSPEYAKFFKLRAMGAPAEAVKAKMRQAGVNPDLLDTPDAELLPPSTPAVTTPAAVVGVRVQDDPVYAKFFKLQSMGAPVAAVKAKMQQAGLNPELLDTPEALLPTAPASNSSSSNNNAEHSSKPAVVLVKDDPAYAKFFKLKTMAPVEVVKMKMQQAGLNPELLDTPDAEMPSVLGESSGVVPPGAPAKMGAALAGMFAKKAAPATDNQAQVVLVKDDPAYAKFFKLVAMGAPPDTVKGKMTMAGLRPELLDTPDAPLPSAAADTSNQSSNATAASVPAAPAPASKRGNLSIKLPSSLPKPTTRPFYWQQLKGDAIKGTIWEEIEREVSSNNSSSNSSNNNNAGPVPVPAPVFEVELASLEKEFPAQTAPMTGPSKSRSLSMDTLPKELLSPRGVVFLIDRSRANNISIIIKQFRMSHAALREAVMKVDTAVLTLERVQGLIKILPTDDEVAAIVGFTGDVLSLNDAERVLKELISVPRLKQRLTAMQAKLQFPSLVRDLEDKVAKLRTASSEIAASSGFKSVLLLVLQVGNRMNAGTARGGAKGFALGDLPKLAQLKSVDKTTTLLHYVARLMRGKHGNAVRLSEALPSLYDVQNIALPELPSDMAKISELVEYVATEMGAHELKNAIEEKEACDHFVRVMREFLATAMATTATLRDAMEQAIHSLQDAMQRFGFHGENEPEESTGGSGGSGAAALASAIEFFTTIYEFCVALTKADRENEVKRLREEARMRQSLKPKTPALGPRSMSSRDMLAGRKAPATAVAAATATVAITEAAKKSEDSPSAAGPETPESSSTRVSPMLRQRSASLSSILENNSTTATLAPAAKSSPEAKDKDTTTTPSKKQPVDSPAGPKASCIRPPTTLPKLNSNGKDKDRALPGRVVKTTKDASPEKDYSSSVSYESPLGLSMPASLDQPKSSKPQPETDEFGAAAAPFDLASIEEIRQELAKKHSNNNHCDHVR